jgi:hypothetical protein
LKAVMPPLGLAFELARPIVFSLIDRTAIDRNVLP